MTTKFRQSCLKSGVIFVALIMNYPVVAQDAVQPRPEARAAIGIGQSDNLNRDASAIRSDITRLELGFAGRTDRQRVRGALTGDVAVLKYGAEGVADNNEVLGSIDGVLELHMVPDRFYWDFLYGYGQTRIDYLGPVGPGNRQRTTVITTGPEIALPIGDRTSLEFGARLSERRYQTTDDLDSRLTTLRLGFVRALSSVAQIALNLERRENEFEIDAETYNFEIASLEYERELASGRAVASIGRGSVEIGSESQPTTVARLAWNRAVGARSQLEICGGRELTDAGSVFAAGGGAVGCQGELSGLAGVQRVTDGRLQGSVSSKSPVRRDSLGIRFDVDSPVAVFSMTVGAAQDRFDNDVDLDNDTTTVQLSSSREFGQRWRGEISLRRWNQDFVTAGTENEDQSARVAFSRLLGRSTRLELSLERNRRVSGLSPFDENVVFLTLGRNFGG